MNSPLVSVVIPTYNSADFVAQAVQSVLDQTYRHFEIIVVDDGSTDETRLVLHQFDNRLKYLYQENRGPSAARNTGIKAAKGEYISFLDADDLWFPNKLQVQLEFMQQHKEIGLAFSDLDEFGHTENEGQRSLLSKFFFYADLLSQKSLDDAFKKLLIENFIMTSTTISRRKSFAKAGLFEETLKVVEDREMWLRIAANFQIACIPVIVGKKRVHSTNISQNDELTLRSRIIGVAKCPFPISYAYSSFDSTSTDV